MVEVNPTRTVTSAGACSKVITSTVSRGRVVDLESRELMDVLCTVGRLPCCWTRWLTISSSELITGNNPVLN